MTPSKICRAVTEYFHQATVPSDQKLTLVELSELAATDSVKFERLLASAGVPPTSEDRYLPVARRKWSELRGFDRSTFDYEAYLAALKD